MSNGRKTEGIAESGALGRGRRPAVPKPILITIAVFIIAIIAVYFTFPSGARKENTSLPKFKSSNFTKVIHAPSVRQLSIWKDNQGRDCLAALEMPWQSNAWVSIYTYDFELANRFKLTSGYHYGFPFATYKSSESDLPIIYLDAVTGYKKIIFESYSSSGNLLYSVPSSNFGQPYQIVDSPSKPGTPLIAGIDIGNPQSLFGFRNISDYSPSPPDAAIVGQYLQQYGPISGVTKTDWDFDGKPDEVYWGRDANGDDILLPVVSGSVGPPIALADAPPDKDNHTIFAFAAAKYRENKTDHVVVAFNYCIWRELSDSKIASIIYRYYAPPMFESSKIYWKNLQTGVDITKQYRNPAMFFDFRDTILLEDLTGDGIPEVIAVVESTRLVIYDLDGNELYNKLFFKQTYGYWGISNLLSGDFDGDGKVDIVFAYQNGIFIPDLSALRN